MRCKGYTAAWLLPILAALMVLLLGAMQRGVEVRESWYQQNIADNMAVSAAVLMAREMNLLAITNRALLANELSIAQVVGIASWYQMMKDVADRSAIISAWIPYLNSITSTIARIVRRMERPLNQVLQGVIYFQQAITTALRATQWYARLAFAMEIPRTLSQIYQQHGQQGDAWQLLHAPGIVPAPWLWWTFIPPQRSGNDAGLSQRLMHASLDAFSAKRSYPWFDLIGLELAKAGGARLVVNDAGAWHWQGIDTVSLHVRGLLDSTELAVGDGASYLGDQIQRIEVEHFGGSAATNPTATEWAADSQLAMGRYATTFSYFNRPQLAPEDWPKVIVRLPQATSKAGVFYSRPQRWFARRDEQLEQANLFNALWQERLESLTLRDRTMLSLFKSEAPHG